MSDRPDIKGHMQQNTDFLHKIMGIIPGYKGYADREQRRDADKMLRMYVAAQYHDQHSALMHVQQHLARAHKLDAIGEVDRLGGVLQRFVDRIEIASYGYTGMFDAIKVEAGELDQIYAFDEALLDGVQQVSAAISAIDTATHGGSDASQASGMDSALSQLGDLLDHLLQTWDHREDLLISGKPMDQADFARYSSAGAPTGPMPATMAPAGAQSGTVATADTSSSAAPTGAGYTAPAPDAGNTGPASSSGYSTSADAGYTPPTSGADNTPTASDAGDVTRRLDNQPPVPEIHYSDMGQPSGATTPDETNKGNQ